MTESYLFVTSSSGATVRVTKAHVYVPNVGPWFADIDLEDSTELSGRVSITLGSLVLSGSVDSSAAGVFAELRRARVVAGGGGWGKALPGRYYHNDASVRALNVVQDVAREAGETLGGFAPARTSVGADYVRTSGPGSRTIEDVSEAPWWVDYAGLTQVGPRPAIVLDSSKFSLLEFDARTRIATLAVDALGDVQIGSTLVDPRLDGPQVVREIEIVAEGPTVRVLAWCGGDGASLARLPRLIRAIARRSTDDQLFGKFRYRVVSMLVDRAQLQIVNKASGAPDGLLVSEWPGVAGTHAKLTPGSIVLVEFIEGDRAQPIVSNFIGRGAPGFVPDRLTLGADSDGDAQDAARKGDTVDVLLPPMILTGFINGTTPITAVVTSPMAKTLGTITTGSKKVGIGT